MKGWHFHPLARIFQVLVVGWRDPCTILGAATSWNTAHAGFSVGNLKYDQSGNILNLKRQAINDVGTYVMDDLNYGYESGGTSNRLQAVDDISAKPDGFNNGNTTATDYGFNIWQDINILAVLNDM